MVEGLVSVITPMHNSEKYIAEAIQSVQEQTYAHWEMIIVDDCSSDKSMGTANRYAIQDDRIKVFGNEHNQGATFSRNRAIEAAEGQYIAFLDSDDVWMSDKLEQQVGIMREQRCALCYGNCEVIDENGKNLNKDRIAPKNITYQQLLRGNPIPCVTVMIDRSVVGNIKMPQIGHEDYATWLSILKNDYLACGTGTILAKYHVSGESLSGNKLKAAQWQWKIYRGYLQLGIVRSIWYFINYVLNAIGKRI